MTRLRALLRDLFTSPRNAAINETLALMDEIEAESRQMIVRCHDCGSTNIYGHAPDGSVMYFPSTPRQAAP